jgi:HEPN domain-containing protein
MRLSKMKKILEIQHKLQCIYEASEEPTVKVPLALQTMEWKYFAESYAAAAKLIAETAPWLFLPRLQLAGHSVELALKACLSASGVQPPNEHNLVKLYCLVSDRGFKLNELEQACIVHLEHFYHQDLSTRTKFKARYPTTPSERRGGAVPDNSVFEAIVRSLCRQAEKVNAANLPT